jgi:hypothetical protein
MKNSVGQLNHKKVYVVYINLCELGLLEDRKNLTEVELEELYPDLNHREINRLYRIIHLIY